MSRRKPSSPCSKSRTDHRRAAPPPKTVTHVLIQLCKQCLDTLQLASCPHRSRSRTRASLAIGACALALATAVAGCGPRSPRRARSLSGIRSAHAHLQHHPSQKIRVTGNLEWRGHLQQPRIDIVGSPQPPGALRLTDTKTPVDVPGNQADSTRLPYTLILTIERPVTITRHERWLGIPVRRSVSQRTYRAQSYLIRVTPPPGWTVSPEQIVVSTDTANADFMLTRKPLSTNSDR